MYKILVVDDDTNNRMLVVNALKKQENYQVLSAINGQMAVKIATQVIPNLILMDWEMPVMNGIEALQQLKQQPTTHQVPIIMYTGIMTASESLQEALNLGAIDFLRKPVETVELLARIRSTLRLQDSIQARIQAEKDKALLIQNMKNQEIELKTKELRESIILSEQYKRQLDDIYTQLSTQLATPNTNQLAKIHRALEANISNSNTWENLAEKVNTIYPQFLNILQLKHPLLTKGELKLAVFIRLGISRKEIAEFLHHSVETVKKNRSRLRKKLELPSDIQLDDYLNQL